MWLVEIRASKRKLLIAYCILRPVKRVQGANTAEPTHCVFGQAGPWFYGTSYEPDSGVIWPRLSETFHHRGTAVAKEASL